MSTPTQRVQTWLSSFATALGEHDLPKLAGLFSEECFWRDLVAFTWNIKTLEGRSAVVHMVDAVAGDIRPHDWSIEGEATEADGITEAWLRFETAHVSGLAHVRLIGGVCWTLLTTAQALKGHEERTGVRRVMGVEHGARRNRRTWSERRADERAQLGVSRQPEVVIVGGGQGGIALGARLRRLGVSTVILEKNARAGDSWRRRYASLTLHDPVWLDHLPYLPFPDDWPVFSPKDKLADWLEAYVKIMDLDYWTRSVCTSATYDAQAEQWGVEVRRDGEEVTLRPRQLVLATGLSGFPRLPDLPGMESFQGDLWHSSRHPGGAGYAGKRAVVVGSGNSAHDICADLWEHGAVVTMIQRSPTTVVRSSAMSEFMSDPLYSEQALANGITTDLADLIVASVPHRVLPTLHRPVYDLIRTRDAAFYQRLEDRGFLFDFGEDDSGLVVKYNRRGSGYYIDVGASDLIADGDIELVVGEVARVSEAGLVMEDGAEIPADLLVFATGYGPMNALAAELISQEVADRVGKVGGLGSSTKNDPGPWEGELRNLWKPTQQEALWFHGGNLQQSRFYSHYLALQLKAREAGIPTPVYGLQEVHHRR